MLGVVHYQALPEKTAMQVVPDLLVSVVAADQVLFRPLADTALMTVQQVLVSAGQPLLVVALIKGNGSRHDPASLGVTEGKGSSGDPGTVIGVKPAALGVVGYGEALDVWQFQGGLRIGCNTG